MPLSLGLGASVCWVLYYHHVPTFSAMLWGVLISVLCCWVGEVSDHFKQITAKASQGLPHLYVTARVSKAVGARLIRPAWSDVICLVVMTVNAYCGWKVWQIVEQILSLITLKPLDHWVFLSVSVIYSLIGVVIPATFFLVSIAERKLFKPVEFWFSSIFFNPFVFHLLIGIGAVVLIVCMVGMLFYYPVAFVWRERIAIWEGVVLGWNTTIQYTWSGLTFIGNVFKQAGIFVWRFARISWFFIHADGVRTNFFYTLPVMWGTLVVKQNGADFWGGLIACFMIGAMIGTSHTYFRSRYRMIFPSLWAWF